MATPLIVKIENGITKIYDSKGNYIQLLQAAELIPQPTTKGFIVKAEI